MPDEYEQMEAAFRAVYDCDPVHAPQSGTWGGFCAGWRAAQAQGNTKTMRDEFAGVALMGLIAGSNYTGEYPEKIAGVAYLYADAMMAARRVPEGRPGV